jgi:CRISPR system Cascade subunit CasE
LAEGLWISRYPILLNDGLDHVLSNQNGFHFYRRFPMLLHKIYLNLRCKEVRRDIADPYEMHSTLCRAFCEQEQKCLPSLFLWRLEPETRNDGMPKLLVQGQTEPEWSRINVADWFAEIPSSPVDVQEKLGLNDKVMANGSQFRYRLRVNPSVKRNGKRIGLYKAEEQDAWFMSQGQKNGFSLKSLHRSQEKMLEGKRRHSEHIKVFSVLYDGVLEVSDEDLFIKAVTWGIGHGKTMGLGLLSIVPIRPSAAA